MMGVEEEVEEAAEEDVADAGVDGGRVRMSCRSGIAVYRHHNFFCGNEKDNITGCLM